MSKTIKIIKTTLDTGDEVNDATDGLNGLKKMLEKNHTKFKDKLKTISKNLLIQRGKNLA